MWFKNLMLYRLTNDFGLTPDEFEAYLETQAFVPCGSQDQSKYGWVPPLGREGNQLIHTTAGYMMLCAKKQERIIPAAVVKEALDEKVQEIEMQQGRKVYKKEKDQLKEEILQTLRPRAFLRSQVTFAYLSPKDGLLVVNSSSANKAEELVHCIRESLGSFPVIPPVSKNAPADVLTNWLQGNELPELFNVDRECELADPLEEGNRIRCKEQDLDAEEIQAHIEAGKRVMKLGVSWDDAIHCVISDDLSIKRLKFSEMILEQAEVADAESKAQQFDQDFAVMSLLLSNFCKDLFKAFGGLKRRTKGAVI